ncbi:WYL domain-containing protein [Streptomyces viridosporus]|uniref:WYL domain-containing protein n=1 Tax=Streptomyces sp. NWU49 TaxID=2201153 RepID=UPI00215AC328
MELWRLAPEVWSWGGQARTTDSLDWPALALGALGAEFRVLEPAELVDQLRDWAARFDRAGRG